ncbi:FAD-dependent oxidoreductase [Sphingomonas flavalba]|uniref:FAD-dependent oxidoreductase n=1 Tax=Sphingomonas flavalba TaxID=2559804 RepID=UPI0039E06686
MIAETQPAAADILIVGSGAAGIALALALEGCGRRVLLVEAGGTRPSPASQAFYRADSVSPDTHIPTELFRRRGYGGTTPLWGGRCIPLDPVDFAARDWIPHSGWPIGYEEVRRYHAAALDLCHAGPESFDAATAFGPAPSPLVDQAPGPEIDINRVERFSLPTDFAASYGDRLQQARDVTVLLDHPVLRITAADGRVTGVETPAGAIAAPCVIIATGGIETPRLLLASGLGGDLVGRYYQTHLHVQVGTMRCAPGARLDYQRSPEGVWCRRYIALDTATLERERLFQINIRPTHPDIADPAHRNPILSAMYFAKGGLVAEYARILTGARNLGAERERRPFAFHLAHLRNMLLGGPMLVAFVARWLRLRTFARRKLPSVFLRNATGRYAMDIHLEQVPNPDSRITLSGTRDALGVPRVTVDWQTTDADRAMFRRGMALMRDASRGSGVELECDDAALDHAVLHPTPGHHIGTARMAHSPADGVCDANGQVFGVAGLYVSGSALFPTGGVANPTLTIVALALRLADHLRAGLGAARPAP